MDKSREGNLRAWILIAGILLILGWGVYAIISSIRESVRTAQRAIEPVTNLSNNVGTQVAQVLRPTPTVIVDPVTIVRQVRSLARLETIQYTIEKVITAETGQGSFSFLFGDRLLLVAHGVVIAGVDLAKLGPEDLRVQDNVLLVHLPEPEIFVATLDNEKSYVYNRETGVFTQGDVNLETTARRAAEQEIENAAVEDGILKQAEQNAENYLYRLLLNLGNYDEVIFVNAPLTP
ncbi:MAG TPA: DUF4230 domain-containing protein [Anaerolineales bacterium]|nr:DUF4230 domain-containing protein [Anaerolineales bacterium]